MGLVRASPRFNKLSRAKKGKAITTEPEKDDEYLQALIDQIDAQDEDEEDAFQIPSQPPYIPPWIDKFKLPKDVDAAKNTPNPASSG